MASQGPRNPGTLANDSSYGTLAWSNPGNAQTSDNVYATASHSVTVPRDTQYLKGTNFGFTLPTSSGYTVLGILVEIERRKNSADVSVLDSRVRIVKGGVIGSTDRADTATEWPTTDAYKGYGGATDLWGETWTPADINGSGFGVVLSATLNRLTGDSVSAYVDHIRITVYYSEPGGQHFAAQVVV